ncbi:hypothetical protein OUZ56_012107 [Daphnia magna]|uniref:Uncharacterized protein n=1 Tax=Daphnia magna TaxID=35525 RepID=A0ABQ9Z249_9CRUS|nr:hypothetical protein OUZ56_012107 [Daphnia magna]
MVISGLEKEDGRERMTGYHWGELRFLVDLRVASSGGGRLLRRVGSKPRDDVVGCSGFFLWFRCSWRNRWEDLRRSGNRFGSFWNDGNSLAKETPISAKDPTSRRFDEVTLIARVSSGFGQNPFSDTTYPANTTL